MSTGESQRSLTTRDVVLGSLVFPLSIVGVFSGLNAWWRSPRIVHLPWRILGVPACLGGLALAAWCLRTVRRMPLGVALVTWGPWGLSRHPIYLAGQLVNLGVTLSVGTPALFVGFAVHVVIDRVVAPFEERGLRRRLGAPYEAYAEAVPRWIPRFSSSRSDIS